MSQQVSIPEMINQSKAVLTSPNEITFERYERSGNLTHAAIYIGIAAVIAGLLGLITPPFGFGGLLSGILGALANFFIFTGLVFYIGRSQGGTGTFDEVAYTFSLFIAPLIVIRAVVGLFAIIPILGPLFIFIVGLVLLVAQVYFAYIAVRSSMNLVDQTKSIITLGGAFLGTLLVYVIIAAIAAAF
jgi:hypothetical protein